MLASNTLRKNCFKFLPSFFATSRLSTLTGSKKWLEHAKVYSDEFGAKRITYKCPKTKAVGFDKSQMFKICEKESEISYHPHTHWSEDALLSVEVEHQPPEKFVDKCALVVVKTIRFFFDRLTWYQYGKHDEKAYIRRIIFLETVAGIPGIIGALHRHFASLRHMSRDYGWIHTLLSEAENERMHLMCAMQLRKKPSLIMKFFVYCAQVGFGLFYFLGYCISPRFCHRFVGYIEEEAVVTYTGMLKNFDAGKLPKLEIPATKMMKNYWGLKEDAKIYDVILAIRADEAHHREVNHVLAELPKNAINPFPPGY